MRVIARMLEGMKTNAKRIQSPGDSPKKAREKSRINKRFFCPNFPIWRKNE